MEELMIKVDDVQKEYRLGAIGGTTLRDEIKRKVAHAMHKEDPTRKIGEEDIEIGEKFLALDGVSFEVKKGEAVGVIGHNGAGKSTLLKLITRITAPTKGNIYLNGRITSMLEVGTGFHSELTGRENVYLNGAILGMTKKEIDAKMEDIIEFSEIRKFIDTPVKRYSSGMYVKLAFSVAAHLDSEIMIMDEVLAVGDMAFQTKCLKKMREAANEEGRTVLYVSHNMSTIRQLCQRCIVMDHGKIIYNGDVDTAIALYMKSADNADRTFYDVRDVERKNCTLIHKLQTVEILNAETNHFFYGDKAKVRFVWRSEQDDNNLQMKMTIASTSRGPVGAVFVGYVNSKIGQNERTLTFDTTYFVPGTYKFICKLYYEDEFGNVRTHDTCTALFITIEPCDKSKHLKQWFSDWGSTVLPCAYID